MAEDEDVIVVVGVGAGEAEPDSVRATIGVSLVAPTVAEALTGAAAAHATVIEVLEAGGVARRDIRTVGYQAGPDYDGARSSSRHRADATLEVRVAGLGEVGSLLARVGEAVGDALRVHSILPEVSDPEPARSAARAAAVSAARKQAEELAAAAGVRLGRLRSLVEGGGGMRAFLAQQRGPIAPAAAAPEVEPGRQAVHVAVTASYEIIPSMPPGGSSTPAAGR